MSYVTHGIKCLAFAGCLGLLTALPACNQALETSTRGMQAGINYMQPLKWRMTYKYRVQDITPDVPYVKSRASAVDPAVPAVGPGTYEVWMVGPREGEEVRDVKMVYAIPEPTSVAPSDGGIQMYYYDFAPDGSLPREIQAMIQWEFITFERYTYWDGIPDTEYDKSSELYQRYTREEPPIDFSKAMIKEAKKCIPEENPDDYVKTALNCYNQVVCNYDYDFGQTFGIMYTGLNAMQNSSRCWENKTGQCDEFANLVCSMLRIAGIPARPVAGFVHEVAVNEDNPTAYPIIAVGGHAWAEFYLPEAGWVPLDPTWGMSQSSKVVNPYYSMMGFARKIPQVDYYFGKHDPWRITMFKGWNTKLNPLPRTPDADDTEQWFVGYTDRKSGIRRLTYGWEGIEAMPSKF
jgi:transglutaminase-like putative cysteine protease